MSIKEAIMQPKEHILEARTMAEAIFRKPPHIQLEMVEEVSKFLTRLHERTVEQLKEKQ